MEVIIIADADADLGRVSLPVNARPDGPGRLHLCASDGSEVYRVDSSGPRLLDRERSRRATRTSGQAGALEWSLGYLAERGIGPGLVLIAGIDVGLKAAGEEGGDSLRRLGADRAVVLSAGTEAADVIDEAVHRHADQMRLVEVLDEFVRDLDDRVPVIDDDPAWVLRLPVRADRRGVDEALATLADGRFGIRATLEDQLATDQPGVTCGGVYDGTGESQHLLIAPSWTALRVTSGVTADDGIELDLRTGVLARRGGAAAGDFRSVRFVSLANAGLMMLRAEATMLEPGTPLHIAAGAAGQSGRIGGTRWVRVAASAGGVAAAAVQWRRRIAGRVTVERRAAFVADPTRLPSAADANDRLARTSKIPFTALLADHRAAWASRWASAQIDIPDDPTMQLAARFAVFHLIASVASHGEAGVGARGLSGPGYAGHVFWDADVFVLPVLAATHPPAARAMLEYRLRRIPAARAHASASGRRGARFPWESARTGDDVTPCLGYIGGIPEPIRTGQDEEHIVADVAWAADHYGAWTGDRTFLTGRGGALVIETARYWASRVRFDTAGRAHLYGVEGPDEYHAPVDDNAYTNVMARWNLTRAAELAATTAVPVDRGEVAEWRRIAEALVDGYDPTTGRYEQFAGYFRLEPLLVTVIGTPPVAADLLLGPDRIAASQVIKQPDVLMLHQLVPNEVAVGSLIPNLDFYGPRTAHGSSLSPAIHAALLAQAGRPDEALTWLRLAARLDLDDLTATTAAGLHFGTLGGVWQALVFGFAGVRADGPVLRVTPRLPAAWSTMTIRLRFQGRRLELRVGHDATVITADHPVHAAGADGSIQTGIRLTLPAH